MSEFKTGELFVYVNGDRWELGVVKRENNSGDGYFCWYHRGDTAANTPTRCMHKLANAGWTHIEQQMDDLRADLQASEHVINQIANAGFDANAENDKLREALRAAWRCAHSGISCSDCRLIAGGCTLQTAMQELGIEGDE